MTEENIRKSWKNLLIPFFTGLVIFTVAVLFHRLGSKHPSPQAFWFFTGAFGFVFMFSSALKMIKFRKYLKGMDKEQ